MTITEISLIIIQGWIDYMTINEKYDYERKNMTITEKKGLLL